MTVNRRGKTVKKSWTSMRRAGALVLFAALLFAALLGAAAPALCADNKAPPSPVRPGALAPAIPPRPSPAPAAAPDESAARTDLAARLDTAKQSLEQIEGFLEDDSLTDAALDHQHDAIEPVKKQNLSGHRRSDAETGGGKGAARPAWRGSRSQGQSASSSRGSGRGSGSRRAGETLRGDRRPAQTRQSAAGAHRSI